MLGHFERACKSTTTILLGHITTGFIFGAVLFSVQVLGLGLDGRFLVPVGRLS
jgi:hypothetical protein